ncbi:uncharacterized protein Z519_10671 [Cladophialophora bantiana CBS 173.52]|uniref:Uncharacterized protein n=1 Tax=Cladophialophora bantiana (strain ATCC 10958 / CBS 173.52 / CDC B-1940 / NIH 8579) TaxID=1442370 RepID=A0A0D2HCJ4_CLAB1|nr:uncharacterized protein Z519_10671 [Cladophialophora bantiana CBS 173.52]KIW88625.1 hypothetical protein Z519_10671 [Cladophialophora bantiana CBS 173.52]
MALRERQWPTMTPKRLQLSFICRTLPQLRTKPRFQKPPQSNHLTARKWHKNLTRFSRKSPKNPKTCSLENARDIDEVMDAFIKIHPPPKYSPVAGKLEMPVILPQRRPKSKERGFIRAYAPMLRTCGVEQVEFLDFLDGFGKALQPQFLLIDAVSMHADFESSISFSQLSMHSIWPGPEQSLPPTSPLAPCFSSSSVPWSSIQSVELSRRQYVKYESNKYLDNMKESFFKPRGLYALVMAYKPESDDLVQHVDMNTHVVTSIATRDSGRGSRFANAAGSSREIEIPESAPLIFSELDALPESEKEKRIQAQRQETRRLF